MRVIFFIGDFESARNLPCLNLILAPSSNRAENQWTSAGCRDKSPVGLEFVTDVELELTTGIVELVCLNGDTEVDANRPDWKEQAKADTHI